MDFTVCYRIREKSVHLL